MLCDAHVHFIPPEISGYTSFYKGVWTDKEKLFSFLDKEGIDKALLVYPSCDAAQKIGPDKECAVYNDCIEALARENSKIIPAAVVDLKSNDITAYVAGLKKRGFRVISLASSYDGKFITGRHLELFNALEDADMAAFVHPQTVNPIGLDRVQDALLMPVLEYSFDLSMCLGVFMMEGVFSRFNIKFIFSSLGGVMPFLKQRFDRVYGMLRSRNMVKDLGKAPSEILARVYVDTSGAALENIRMAIELFGAGGVLWGSDYPAAASVSDNLRELDALGPELKAKIAGENFPF